MELNTCTTKSFFSFVVYYLHLFLIYLLIRVGRRRKSESSDPAIVQHSNRPFGLNVHVVLVAQSMTKQSRELN